MYTPEHVMTGALAYARSAILPNLSGTNRILAAAALGYAQTQSDNYIKLITDNTYLTALGVISKDGSVDVEGASKALTSALKEQGIWTVMVPVLNIKLDFDESDVRALREHIRVAAGEGVTAGA